MAEKTEKQAKAMLKVRMRNLLNMIDKNSMEKNKNKLFDLYSFCTDLMYD